MKNKVIDFFSFAVTGGILGTILLWVFYFLMEVFSRQPVETDSATVFTVIIYFVAALFSLFLGKNLRRRPMLVKFARAVFFSVLLSISLSYLGVGGAIIGLSILPVFYFIYFRFLIRALRDRWASTAP